MSALLDTNILIYYFNGLIDDEKIDSLRRKFKTKTPDAIIAATALVNNMSVVTNNRSDFEALGLDVIGINVK